MAIEPNAAINQAVFEICPKVLSGSLKVSNAADMQGFGYTPEPRDEEGDWVSQTVGEYAIKIGAKVGKPSCMVRFETQDSAAAYEVLLKQWLSRGYVFPDGRRKPAEPQFVMDTLANKKDNSSVGLISMFRMLMPGATTVAISVFPGLGGK